MSPTLYLLAAAILPLISFILLIALGKRLARFAGPLATTLAFVSLGLSLSGLILFVSKWVDKPGTVQPYAFEAVTYRWITLPGVPPHDFLARPAPAITVGVLVDSLTVAFFLLITFIAAMVHVFFLGDPVLNTPSKAPRTFAFLNLMLFSTLTLLLSNSLFQLFIAWQLLGLSTYFLINLHTDRRAPVMASLRAFVFNRISDGAFLIALGMLVSHAGEAAGVSAFPALSLFDAEGHSVLTDSIRAALGIRASAFLVYPGAGFLGLHWLTWTGILFITAILIRAAQFPFFWISDSAHAPPAASALMQTCTTLASSIYLLARIYPILTLDARLILAIIACASLFLTALIACAQTDFRQILAWMSVSQFGFILLFLGAGAYTSGLLHLFTHAFSKAILLLALAAVLQSLPPERLPHPTALWKRFPVTAAASLLALLALAGAPFLSGAYSTNLGLAAVYQYAAALRGSPSLNNPFAPEMLLFWLPILATYLTAFALGRFWWLLFINPSNLTSRHLRAGAEKVARSAAASPPEEALHESALGTLPLILLLGFTVGLLFDFLRIPVFLDRSLAPAVVPFTFHPADHFLSTTANLTALAPAAMALAWLLHFAGAGPGSLPHRLVRLPVINIVHAYLRESLFLETFLNLAASLVFLLVRIVGFTDRYILGAALRILAFATEALAHLLARLDNSLDRPGKTAALLLAPRLRRWFPSDPPPSL